MIKDDEMVEVLRLIHPAAFDESYKPGTTTKGLAEIDLAEGVKLQLVNILDHICDIQLRHRIESFVSFTDGFVGDLQQDQCQRYLDIKQTDMPPAEAAKRTKEFRCPPKEQMFRLLKCKIKDDGSDVLLDDEVEYDRCPMSESLQETLRDFCAMVVAKVGNKVQEEDRAGEMINAEEESSWVDSLAQLVISVPPAPEREDPNSGRQGTENLKLVFVHFVIRSVKN
jgi:ryanodine receptor 2